MVNPGRKPWPAVCVDCKTSSSAIVCTHPPGHLLATSAAVRRDERDAYKDQSELPHSKASPRIPAELPPSTACLAVKLALMARGWGGDSATACAEGYILSPLVGLTVRKRCVPRLFTRAHAALGALGQGKPPYKTRSVTAPPRCAIHSWLYV